MPRGDPKKRISLSLTSDTHARLMRMRDSLPGGATASGIVEEVLANSLPALEELVAALNQARTDDGVFDEQRGRDELARWAGAQMLELSHGWMSKTGTEEEG